MKTKINVTLGIVAAVFLSIFYADLLFRAFTR